MAIVTSEEYAQILDNLPQIIMRLTYEAPNWGVVYVNKAVERYGYRREDFGPGKMTWNDMLHPDDRVVAVNLAADYMAKGIDDFKIQYRVRTKDGASIYITEYSHVNRTDGRGSETIDSFLFENLEVRAADSPEADAAVSRNLALNDILLTLQDAKADPEKAIQFILDRVGALLDCSRALLFRDSPDHKTCKVVYEWLNHGISSIKELDYAVTYSTEMPEIYVALQDTGVLLVNAGEIPENCREEFEAEGLVSSAIFAVYQHGDHYGFVCFDDCVVKRRWDPDTANFLKVVANLLSNAVMNLTGVRYMEEYENKIKELAFRDYVTGLPNRYPYDSDLGDAVLAANAAGAPGFAGRLALGDIGEIRNAHGLRVTDKVCKAVAEDLRAALARTLGDRGTLYRIADSVFAFIALPGPAEPARAFAEYAAGRGGEPWPVDGGEFACRLNVAVVPFGTRVFDPERIDAGLDAAMVESGRDSAPRLVFRAGEE